jgi:uncharacterized membrane protein
MPGVSAAGSIYGAHPTSLRPLPDHRSYHHLTHRRHDLLIIVAERLLSPIIPDRFYFPGEGLLLVLAMLYLMGLTLTSVVGRWIWNSIALALSRLPGLARSIAP